MYQVCKKVGQYELLVFFRGNQLLTRQSNLLYYLRSFGIKQDACEIRKKGNTSEGIIRKRRDNNSNMKRVEIKKGRKSEYEGSKLVSKGGIGSGLEFIFLLGY